MIFGARQSAQSMNCLAHGTVQAYQAKRGEKASPSTGDHRNQWSSASSNNGWCQIAWQKLLLLLGENYADCLLTFTFLC